MVVGTELAKLIRKDLKMNFPKQKFSVRNQRGGYSTAINISWKDGVAQNKVKPIAWKYEKIDRDEYSGEILSGGNTFVFTNREISDSNMEKIRKKIEKKRAFSSTIPKWQQDQFLAQETWQKINETDF